MDTKLRTYLKSLEITDPEMCTVIVNGINREIVDAFEDGFYAGLAHGDDTDGDDDDAACRRALLQYKELRHENG